MIPTSWPDFVERGRLGGRKENKDSKAGRHGGTEAPIGHDHRPRWFVRGAECWKVSGCGRRRCERIESLRKRAKSGVVGKKNRGAFWLKPRQGLLAHDDLRVG